VSLKRWRVWFINPIHPERSGAVRSTWTRRGASRLARRWSDEAVLADLSYWWEVRRG
jgi:hypothetical protein